MTSMEIIGIYALLVINLGISVILVRAAALAALQISNSIQELDENIATVIAGLGQSMPAVSMEGVNPIQMAIAQWIGAQADARSKTIDTTITTRTEGGQFTSRPKLEDF